MPDQTAVRFGDVYKAFASNAVYEGLNLEIRRGEILTVLGGSGTGKSILLKITQLDERQLLPVRRKVGMLFQGGALFDSMDVFDNVAYPLVERGERDSEAIQARVAEVLEMVGLSGSEALTPSELSGGMKKRVALARALSAVPEVLLYDEPTTGLDPMNVRRICELVLRLREELHVTSVIVTHDLAAAFRVSDRMAMLANRRIVEIAELSRFKHSSVKEVREFIQAMPVETDRGEART
jgi:phospholipid/cholesterol/gamma-HCH transport system ATP-binding protein